MGREPLGPPPPGGRLPHTDYPVRPDHVGAPDEPGGPLWPERVEEQIRKLKQLAAVLGLLAALATGLALWALLDDDEGGDGRGASRASVSRLDDRVDRLENRLGNASEENDISNVREDLQDKANKEDVANLQGEVEQLRQAVARAGRGDDSAQAVEELSARVDQLEQDVQELQREQEQQP